MPLERVRLYNLAGGIPYQLLIRSVTVVFDKIIEVWPFCKIIWAGIRPTRGRGGWQLLEVSKIGYECIPGG